MQRQVSTLWGIITIFVTIVILFGGVFTYQYLGQQNNLVLDPATNAVKTNNTSCLDTAMTQLDINVCAGNLYSAADAKLNALYQKITAQLDAPSLSQLTIAEKAWINYRDANCKVSGTFAERGSGASADEVLCMEKLTNDRIQELKNMYQGYVTGIEGTIVATESVPLTINQCVKTHIAKITTRLVDGNTGAEISGSGSQIMYTNNIYGVSYETIEAIESSHVGDEITLCLVSIPTGCPAGDDRGKAYHATNVRTGKDWSLLDSEHMCGGA